VISALQQSDKSTVWEELTGVEKLIIHTLKDPSEKSSLQQLIELLSVGTFHMARPLESGHAIVEACAGTADGVDTAGKFTASDVIGLSVMAHSLIGQRFAHEDDKAFQKALIENLISFPQVRRVALRFCCVRGGSNVRYHAAPWPPV
jgi:hypothetical protein